MNRCCIIVVILLSLSSFNLVKATCGTSKIEIPDTSTIIENDSIFLNTLKEVVITGELIQRRGNQDIITITKDMRYGTHTTGELLGKIPGFYLNPVSTDLTYCGSNNIVILVDSIEKDAEYIKRLNPERFDKVGIIHFPSGKYNGYDAIVSLHTKPTYRGYDGTLLAQLLSATNGRNGNKNDLKNLTGIGQISYTFEKWNFDFLTGWNWTNQGLTELYQKDFPFNSLVETTINQSDKVPNARTYDGKFYADIATDWDIDKRNSLSLRFKISPSWVHEDKNFLLQQSHNTTLIDTITKHNKSNIDNKLDLLAGMWYRGKIKHWNINASLCYNNSNYLWLNSVKASSGFTLYDNRRIKTYYWVGGVDANIYFKNSKWSFSASNYFIYSKYNESRKETMALLSQTNDFRNTTYLSLNWFPNDKISCGIDIGGALFKSYDGKNSDTQINPKIGIQTLWIPSRNLIARLHYSVTNSFPPLSQLQDYGQFIDSLIWRAGNPSLKSELVHTASINLTVFNRLILCATYNHTHNNVFPFYNIRYGMTPSKIETFFACQNYVNGVYKTWNVSATYSQLFLKHFQFSLTATMQGLNARFENNKNTKLLPEYSWYFLYQTLNNTLSLYLSGSMTSYAIVAPQTKQWCYDDGFAITLSKTFCNNKIQAQGMWYLPLHFVNGRWHGGLDSDAMIIRYFANNQWRKNNMFQFTFVYRFNGGQSVRKYSRTSETIEI